MISRTFSITQSGLEIGTFNWIGPTPGVLRISSGGGMGGGNNKFFNYKKRVFCQFQSEWFGIYKNKIVLYQVN